MMAAVSSTQLQAHYDEIMSQMSVLPLTILPKVAAASLQLDAAATRAAKKAAAELHECQVCNGSSEPEQLQPQFTTRLHFHDRVVHVTAVRFVCPLCAAASNANLLLQLLTPEVGTQPTEQRSQQLQQLLLHFAAVNNAPASITSNPDTLTMVVQELACRAYSLGVVASSLGGWQQQPAATSAAQLLQQLLKGQRKAAAEAAAAAGGGVGLQANAAGAAGGVSSKKLKKKVKDQPAVQQAAAAEAHDDAAAAARHKQHKKRRSDAATAAVATPAASHQHLKHPQQPPSTTPKSTKKHTPGSSKGSKGAHPTHASTPRAGSKQGSGVHLASGLHTPQHSKVKPSSSKKQKLLQSAPR